MNQNASVLINKKSGHGIDIDHKHSTIRKRCSKDTVFKVGAGALFVLITEMCLGLLIYQHMAREFSDVRSNFALRAEMEDYFFRLFRSDALQDEFSTSVLEKISTKGILSRIKRHNYFYLGHNCKPKQRQRQATSLEASPADDGRAVIQGPPGLPGLPGRKGEQGDRGPKGIKGSIGRDGVPGKQGVRGERGDNGKNGQPGYLGLPGLRGIPGRSGLPGNDGLPGPIGPPGPPGSPSSAGPSDPVEKEERVDPTVPETEGTQLVSRLPEYKRNSVKLPETATEIWRSQTSDIPSDFLTFSPGAIGAQGTAPPPPTESPITTEFYNEYQRNYHYD